MKIQNIFATLTARYGKPQPKDGQQIQAIAQSWNMAVGRYSLADLQTACVHWMNTSKFPRWPEPAEVLEILRDMGCQQEAAPEADSRPYAVRQAQHDSSEWFKHTVTSRAPDYAFPFTMEMAVMHIIGAERRENAGKKLGRLLTDAWLRGDIPNGFDVKAKAYFAEMQEHKQKYWAAAKKYGHVAVNERRVQFMNQ